MDVGKTSLQLKYVKPQAQVVQEKIKTQGTDKNTVFVNVADQLDAKIVIWDTAGQEKHANIVGAYVKNVDACLMVFDLTRQYSFESIQRWIKQLMQTSGGIPVVIVGNKYDLTEQRDVSIEQIEEMGRTQNVHVFETSAKTGYNVESAFKCLLYQVLKPCLQIYDKIKVDSKHGDTRL